MNAKTWVIMQIGCSDWKYFWGDRREKLPCEFVVKLQGKIRSHLAGCTAEGIVVSYISMLVVEIKWDP
jgi:hypothetical protein